ncbi:MAG: YgeY family selenium metabolism-linked hydrolase [Ignavibacteria bacterium]|jgi:putative selenium metabolism hydrolase|nr:YgeY family selenium metabolism-linked hydrolase [Ignavibacteria bacterium]MCU7516640.1 YgeY family selenium metabolism-linked hydrolase [Ignavibacteria bacterium]
MELAQRIFELAKGYQHYTAENLSRLVRHKSLSTKEKDCALELKKMMSEAGFDEVKTDGLGNVIGRIGSGSRVIAFDAHIDTVDVGDRANWHFGPFSGEIKDGFVYGRGCADQKGGAAALVTAGRIIKELGLSEGKTIYFTGSVMEEDCDGLCWKYIIEEDNIKPDFVVITEPTSLNIYRGQRGRVEIEVSFHGLSSHASAPERGINAVYMGAKAALKLELLNECLASDRFLGKGSLSVTEFISSSPSLCAVADYSRIHLDRRLTWGEDKQVALREVEELIKDMNAKAEVLSYKEKAYTGLEYGMEKYYPTWKLEEDHPLILTGKETFEELFNRNASIDKWTFSTNGVVINGLYGIPVLGFGPGDEAMAHAPDEKVPVEHLFKASAFYAYLCSKV